MANQRSTVSVRLLTAVVCAVSHTESPCWVPISPISAGRVLGPFDENWSGAAGADRLFGSAHKERFTTQIGVPMVVGQAASLTRGLVRPLAHPLGQLIWQRGR